jgi:hypothetical protein
MKMLFAFICMIVLAVQSTSVPHCDEIQMRQLANDSELIVVAEIVEVGRAPGIWSGLLLVAQNVRYEVKEVLKGKVLDKCQITVAHYVVKNSLTADTTEPRLSPKTFKTGNRLVLFLAADPGKGKYVSLSPPDPQTKTYVVPEVNCGAMLAEESVLKSIRQAASAK